MRDRRDDRACLHLLEPLPVSLSSVLREFSVDLLDSTFLVVNKPDYQFTL